MPVPRSIVLTGLNIIPSKTINEWTVDQIYGLDSCKCYHVSEQHSSSTGSPTLSWLFWLVLNLFFWGALGNRIIHLFVCLSTLTSTKQSQTGGVIMLFASTFTDMNEYKGNSSKKKRWNLITCRLCGFCVTEEERWNTFRRIIALVNNGGLPVLHSIMGRTGSGPFHQGEINKRTAEPEETRIQGKWVLYEED